VVIDEYSAPELLNVVHQKIETRRLRFVLSDRARESSVARGEPARGRASAARSIRSSESSRRVFAREHARMGGASIVWRRPTAATFRGLRADVPEGRDQPSGDAEPAGLRAISADRRLFHGRTLNVSRSRVTRASLAPRARVSRDSRRHAVHVSSALWRGCACASGVTRSSTGRPGLVRASSATAARRMRLRRPLVRGMVAQLLRLSRLSEDL